MKLQVRSETRLILPPIVCEKMTKRIFSKGRATVELILGDCFAGMDAMPAGSVDVVVTSPPYNLGIGYSLSDDTRDRGAYLDWLDEWAGKVARVLAPAGSLFLNIGGKPKDPWGPMEAAMRLREHFRLQNTIHWIKSIAVDRTYSPNGHPVEGINLGHIKPINSRRFLSDAHEFVFHFTLSGEVELDRLAIGVPYKDKSNIGRWKNAGKDLRCRGNAWFIPYGTIQSRAKERPHPASFPPLLPEMCVKLHGPDRVNLVMDPFMGLGNTALACVDMGISCVGYEMDPEYHDHSCRRVAARLVPGDPKDSSTREHEQPSIFDGCP